MNQGIPSRQCARHRFRSDRNGLGIANGQACSREREFILPYKTDKGGIDQTARLAIARTFTGLDNAKLTSGQFGTLSDLDRVNSLSRRERRDKYQFMKRHGLNTDKEFLRFIADNPVKAGFLFPNNPVHDGELSRIEDIARGINPYRKAGTGQSESIYKPTVSKIQGANPSGGKLKVYTSLPDDRIEKPLVANPIIPGSREARLAIIRRKRKQDFAQKLDFSGFPDHLTGGGPNGLD